ncbi:MAG: recombination protein RecR, partial [Bacteroidales bacterium]|nr:recombination protein RecR [Bacteroidales bacterium]
MDRNYSSKVLAQAVHEISRLPGIGEKTALRLALHILKKDLTQAKALGNSIISLKENIKICKICNNISDSDFCSICTSNERDDTIICVVENTRDVMAVENTGQFFGHYHVLGGIISPMDGIGPADLSIDSLVERIEQNGIKEIIFALPTTMEGDTTNFYLYKKLTHTNT